MNEILSDIARQKYSEHLNKHGMESLSPSEYMADHCMWDFTDDPSFHKEVDRLAVEEDDYKKFCEDAWAKFLPVAEDVLEEVAYDEADHRGRVKDPDGYYGVAGRAL